LDAPLAGVRVVDVSTSYAAPTATMYLADLGAEVIKVERLGGGDDTRGWGPPFSGGESAWFLSANRGKRSLCLDISSSAGHEALMRLLADADVFVQNVNPSKLVKLGIDPDRLRSRFPRLIYCSISGFGLTGPDSTTPGYDLIAQAQSGLMSVTGQFGGNPQRVSTALSDVAAGTLAALAVSAALVRQQRTGEGELVDVSLLEADLAFMSPRIASYLMGTPEPAPSGGTDSVLAVYQPFETRDRPIVVAVGNDRMWQRFCTAVGLDDLGADGELTSNAGRVRHRARVIAAVAERMLDRTAHEWLELLSANAIPSAPILSLSEVVAHPQVVARRSIATVEHPVAGEVRLVNVPWRLGSAANGGNGRPEPAPQLGADGRAILESYGFTMSEIDEMIACGTLWLPEPAAAEPVAMPLEEVP
jgi:crotonobetainyl-CoA:carnitine CoA-transferase CaiB-like acyl-CoA transferase